MHFRTKRNSILQFLLFSILFLGMCFGNVRTDSLFEYADSDFIQADSTFPGAVIQSAGHTAPLEQVYQHKTFSHNETVFATRHTIRRTSIRMSRGCGFLFIFVIALSLIFQGFFPYKILTLFHEIISNTVILSYIHHQDGQKPSPLFLS